MTHDELTIWAIGLKVGLTVLGGAVLAVVLRIRWKRYRKRQDAIDEGIIGGK